MGELDLLRKPFDVSQISKLPKPTKAQTDAVKADFKAGGRCQMCGGWHHKDVVHLDYVGHAALTNRLLDVDPAWHWEPMAVDSDGLPKFDKIGGLWIRLHILNVVTIGYGHPDDKTGGNAIKEAIGDALRNAAMRRGAALDLWHKGEAPLYSEDEPVQEPLITEQQASEIKSKLEVAGITVKAFCDFGGFLQIEHLPAKNYAGAIKWIQSQPINGVEL